MAQDEGGTPRTISTSLAATELRGGLAPSARLEGITNRRFASSLQWAAPVGTGLTAAICRLRIGVVRIAVSRRHSFAFGKPPFEFRNPGFSGIKSRLRLSELRLHDVTLRIGFITLRIGRMAPRL